METIRTLWKKSIVKGALLVIIVFIFALIIRTNNGAVNEPEVTSLKSVELTTAAEVAGEQKITLIGTVRAFTEADITTERAGRITSVRATLGGTVGAGQIIATIENASEQAAVLQAQGAYEAAQAAAAQTSISVDETAVQVSVAKDSLKNAIRSSYNIANSAVRTNIDTFFSNPDSNIPGLRIDGRGQTGFFNDERVAYQGLLQEWQSRANNISNNSDLTSEADYSQAQLNRTISYVDAFITIFANQPGNGRYTEAELDGFITTFTGLRSSLISADSAIDNAEAQLRSTLEAERRATVSASGGSASATDAQVKQALGSLRAAQANLEKTILRSPISGTVNSLSISLGDFVGSFEQVAVVANNNALEIVTYVGDAERDQLAVGDEVLIDGTASGIITTVAPSIDEVTRKTEVRIAAEDESISNGDTVRIIKNAETEARLESIRVPLSAVKFEATDGFVLQVTDGLITQKPVVLGAVRGNQVIVTDGLTANEPFIRDVRGLTIGSAVNVQE